MFLALTADDRYWNKDEEILFLGEWCKRYDRKDLWKNLKHHVIPYHWDDRKKYFNDYQYCFKIYEKYLPELAKSLNNIHGEAHDTRYWRIIIGYWLLLFIGVTYDRLLSIRNAEKSGKADYTYLPKSFDPDDFIPDNLNQFIDDSFSDAYNLVIYGEIIKFTGVIKISYLELERTKKETKEVTPYISRSWLKKAKSTIFKYAYNMAPGNFKRVVCVNSYLRGWEFKKLMLSLSTLPFTPEMTNDNIVTEKIDKTLRNSILLSHNQDIFERILSHTIPMHIPKIYLEGYRRVSDHVKKNYPSKTKLIFNSNFHSTGEDCKIWTAQQVENGSKLALAQHGGYYGTAKMLDSENYELEICDKFLSWGWKDSNNNKIVPLRSGYLSEAAKIKNNNTNGHILYVLVSLPRYFYRFFSSPIGPQMINYFDYQRSFLAHLDDSVKTKIKTRFYPGDYGWNEKVLFKEMGSPGGLSDSSVPFLEDIQNSRLTIITYNSTCILESFTANLPTLIIWDPNYYEIRDDASDYFSMLHNANILHYTPESAASFANNIYETPMKWWKSKEVQNARNLFSEKFCKTGNDWVYRYTEKFKRLIENIQ